MLSYLSCCCISSILVHISHVLSVESSLQWWCIPWVKKTGHHTFIHKFAKFWPIFIACQHDCVCQVQYCYGKSVCLSHAGIVSKRILILSNTFHHLVGHDLVSTTITAVTKFQGKLPRWWHYIQGWTWKNGNFPPKSSFVGKAMR